MIAIQLRFTATFADETEQVKACAKILDKIYKDIKAAESAKSACWTEVMVLFALV